MDVKNLLKDVLFGALLPWSVLCYTYNRQHGYFAERYDVLLISVLTVFLIALLLRILGIKGSLILVLWLAILLPSLVPSRVLDLGIRVAVFVTGIFLLKKIPRKALIFLLSIVCIANVFSVCQRDMVSRKKAKDLTDDRENHPSLPLTENIYWFVLDAYTNFENLKEYYRFDNTNFYKQLADLGFLIQDGKLPYREINTFPTLKALNFYTNFNCFDVTKEHALTLHFCLKNNRLFKMFFKNGYRVQASDSRFPFLHMLPVQSLGLSYHGALLQFLYHCCRQNIFLKRPMEAALNRQLYNHQNSIFKFLEHEFYPKKKCLYYIHIDSPHAPFVRNERNEFFNDRQSTIWGENEVGLHAYVLADYRKMYVNQLNGLNKNIISMLNTVLEKDPEAWIVLQGDHGTFMTHDNREQSGFLFAVKGKTKSNQLRAETFFKQLIYGE